MFIDFLASRGRTSSCHATKARCRHRRSTRSSGAFAYASCLDVVGLAKPPRSGLRQVCVQPVRSSFKASKKGRDRKSHRCLSELAGLGRNCLRPRRIGLALSLGVWAKSLRAFHPKAVAVDEAKALVGSTLPTA